MRAAVVQLSKASAFGPTQMSIRRTTGHIFVSFVAACGYERYTPESWL
jgi:hypothetical protein